MARVACSTGARGAWLQLRSTRRPEARKKGLTLGRPEPVARRDFIFSVYPPGRTVPDEPRRAGRRCPLQAFRWTLAVVGIYALLLLLIVTFLLPPTQFELVYLDLGR